MAYFYQVVNDSYNFFFNFQELFYQDHFLLFLINFSNIYTVRGSAEDLERANLPLFIFFNRKFNNIASVMKRLIKVNIIIIILVSHLTLKDY
jgi:hypothetical protein